MKKCINYDCNNEKLFGYAFCLECKKIEDQKIIETIDEYELEISRRMINRLRMINNE